MAVIVKKMPPIAIKLYRFGTVTDGSAAMKDILGGKGANLAEMSKLSLPVPDGFTIPCEVSVRYKKVKSNQKASDAYLNYLWTVVDGGLKYLSNCFGYMPLLSIRSGARVSMPGMMDTILNIGLTEDTIPFWVSKIGDRAVYDSYRRLIQMYSTVVWGIPADQFDEKLNGVKKEFGVQEDTGLTVEALKRVVFEFLLVVGFNGYTFPQTLEDQLHGAIIAVFKSWDNKRACEYRALNGYPDDWGTAVNVQGMVFGNMGNDSCTGVVFTRDPNNGENEITGEYLVNAQGEDVVAGVRTPLNISSLVDWDVEVAKKLCKHLDILEQHYKDMQDVEFTVQKGKLYLLQTRNGKRTSQAAFKIVHDLVEEGVLDIHDVLKRVTRAQLLSVLQDKVNDAALEKEPDLVGIPGGGGVVTGVAVYTSEDAINCTKPCILIREETDPNDLLGMNASIGVLTATGGLTSHAAVVARGMNKTCVVGCTGLMISVPYQSACAPNGSTLSNGEVVTIDGSTGNVWFNYEVPITKGGLTDETIQVLRWVAESKDCVERLDIRKGMTREDLNRAVSRVVSLSLYIDTALLELESPIGKTLGDRLDYLGTALGGFEGKEIIVDLSWLAELYDNIDLNYFLSFGQGKPSSYDEKLTHIYSWPSSVLSKVVLKGTKQAQKHLKGSGMRMVRDINTVQDLLDVDSCYEVTPETIEKVFGTPEAFELVKGILDSKFERQQSRQLGKPLYWYQILEN